MITGNVIGGILKNPDTIILIDEEGNEYPAYMTGEEVDLTATVNDIRIGKVAAIAGGAKVGEKVIPCYHTSEGFVAVPVGSAIRINTKDYDYTKLQALVCKYNTSSADSVATEKVSINSKVYPVNSTEAVATVTVDHDTKEVVLGISNDGDSPLIIRYFMYKEIY